MCLLLLVFVFRRNNYAWDRVVKKKRQKKKRNKVIKNKSSTKKKNRNVWKFCATESSYYFLFCLWAIWLFGWLMHIEWWAQTLFYFSYFLYLQCSRSFYLGGIKASHPQPMQPINLTYRICQWIQLFSSSRFKCVCEGLFWLISIVWQFCLLPLLTVAIAFSKKKKISSFATKHEKKQIKAHNKTS